MFTLLVVLKCLFFQHVLCSQCLNKQCFGSEKARLLLSISSPKGKKPGCQLQLQVINKPGGKRVWPTSRGPCSRKIRKQKEKQKREDADNLVIPVVRVTFIQHASKTEWRNGHTQLLYMDVNVDANCLIIEYVASAIIHIILK